MTLTKWLIALLVVAAGCCAAGTWRWLGAREAADRAVTAAVEARQVADELADGGVGGSLLAEGDGALETLVLSAAEEAQVADKLAGILPGQPTAVGGRDRGVERTEVLLVLDAMTLAQLGRLVDALETRAPFLRAELIALEAPVGRQQTDGGEALWSASVALGVYRATDEETR